MFLLGHLGLTLLAVWLLRPLLPAGDGVPVGYVLVGALLPDLIDKPLGHVLLGWDNGRLWAHTLLFAVALLGLATYVGSRWGLTMGVATLIHQGLDQAWLDPASWLWPLAGPFPTGVSAGVPEWWAALLSDPFLWTTEALGGLALVALLFGPWLGLGSRWWQPSAPSPSQPAEDVVPEAARREAEAARE